MGSTLAFLAIPMRFLAFVLRLGSGLDGLLKRYKLLCARLMILESEEK